ncbi:hypothetical protein BDP27DRAFT_1417605 [Rhodocollybia butyracea]|uniref:Uncharacterized protein n=1 Tax=Rhodocollybia butyracea TaxID=206335 RepID=A0A9P5Q2D3_9AGAR|nr:hypothetical protein BDP27DRAFT_1417605 [Rhodocollybia butyracea]
MLIPYQLNASANSVANITESLSVSTTTILEDNTLGTCSGIRCRTALQIFWSCTSVLIACIWVSIHPNIPGPRDRWWRVLAEKIFLMLITLTVPEMMLFWAIRDWSSARLLATRLKMIGWTKTHAFFALMGGFALYEGKEFICVLRIMPISEEHQNIQDCIAGASCNTSELDDRSLLAHAHFIGQMTKHEVKDRSHSDAFSKFIAVAQTTWLVIQLVARAARGLPATELEIMTAAFVFMNLLLYFFWWNKPQGVECPIRIQRTRKVTADFDHSEIASSVSLQPPSTFSEQDFSTIEAGDGGEDPTFPSTVKARDGGKDLTIPSLPAPRKEPQFSLSTLTSILKTIPHAVLHWMHLTMTFLAASIHLVWRSICHEFRGRFGAKYDHSNTIVKNFWIVLFVIMCPFIFIARLAAFTFGDLDRCAEKVLSFEGHLGIPRVNRESPSMILICYGAAEIFGAIHCAALALTFPSAREQLLWKISSLTVVGAPAIVFINYRFKEYTGMAATDSVLHILVILVLVLYPLARSTLIVLAFTELKHLPSGALETIQWTTFFPHI